MLHIKNNNGVDELLKDMGIDISFPELEPNIEPNSEEPIPDNTKTQEK